MRSLINISVLKNTYNNQNHYKYKNLLLVFYIVYDIAMAFFSCKLLSESFHLPFLVFTTALISFAFIMDDIVAEVYGIKNSAIFYFSMVLARIVLSIYLSIFYGHLLIARYLFFIAFYHPIVNTFSWYINVYFLTKWKRLAQGKHFWLRSIGSSAIAMSIFCLFMIIDDVKLSNWSANQIFFDIVLSYFIRIISIIIYSIPASFIVNILKIVEHTNNNMEENVFNPFKNQIVNKMSHYENHHIPKKI